MNYSITADLRDPQYQLFIWDDPYKDMASSYISCLHWWINNRMMKATLPKCVSYSKHFRETELVSDLVSVVHRESIHCVLRHVRNKRSPVSLSDLLNNYDNFCLAITSVFSNSQGNSGRTISIISSNCIDVQLDKCCS